MLTKHILQVKYNCGSVKDQFFVSYFETGLGIGANHCPLYSRDMEACDEDLDCGNFEVMKAMPYSKSEAKRLNATDLTIEESKKNLVGMIEAA